MRHVVRGIMLSAALVLWAGPAAAADPPRQRLDLGAPEGDDLRDHGGVLLPLAPGPTGPTAKT